MQTKTKVSTEKAQARRRPKATRKKATVHPSPVAYPVTLQVRVTEEQAEGARRMAAGGGRTLSEYLRVLLTRDLDGATRASSRKGGA
jgi:hypothetical protein